MKQIGLEAAEQTCTMWLEVPTFGGEIALRILLVFAVLVTLYGCGQVSSPPEQPEKEQNAEQPKTVTPEGADQQDTTQQVVGNMPIAGIVGENVDAGSYDFRILDYFVTDHYYYLTDPYIDEVQDYYSQAGKFVVVNYSVTNTSPQTISPNPIGQLHARAGERMEIYEENGDITPPHHDLSGLPMDDLPPRQMVVSQF